MISSADVTGEHLEAVAQALACKGTWVGYWPCDPYGCPFGKKPLSEDCRTVTTEMWEAELERQKREAEADDEDE